ncbi:hypothetical protein LCGC14_2476790, partial [marine sediment metagenome]
VEPETSMTELREILRSHRISGTPVVSNGQLVGIISIEDFINWQAEGSVEASVGERMTRQVKTVYEDEPLVHVVSRLERHGFGRFPIIERSSSKLVGVITEGDIFRRPLLPKR